MIPALIDEVLKGHYLLRRERRYREGFIHYNNRSALVEGI